VIQRFLTGSSRGTKGNPTSQEAAIQYPITHYVYRPLSTRIANALAPTGISAMTVTWISTFLALTGAGLLAGRLYVAGAIVTFVAVIADCADGDLARATGSASATGAFVDSVMDRWTDAALILGIVYSDLDAYAAIGGLALTASLLTSYTRARAQGLGTDCPEGFGARDSRILILIVSVLAGYIWWGLLLVSVVGFVTSIQRAVLGARRLSAGDA
jgi:phosphatidylglycerophosphate synthase